MSLRPAVLAVALLCPLARAAAQHDYRNLDRERPIETEDAYPVEYRALEVMVPMSLEREAGETATMFEPEFMFGAVLNGMIGMAAPIVLGDGGGLAGLRPFAFYNFNTEMPGLPALALRADLATPVGALGGDGVLATFTAIATRSFGVTRLHLNAAATLGKALDAPLDDAPGRWSASLGIDHTLWRASVALMADLRLLEPLGGGALELVGGAGWRMQVTPTLVFDLGGARRLTDGGPDLVLTAGLTRSLAWLAGGVE
jgi:hypothetical protein